MSKTELKVRFETYMQSYISDCLVEAKTLCDICLKKVFNNVEKYICHLIDTNSMLDKFNSKLNLLLDIEEVAKKQGSLKEKVKKLQESLQEIKKIELLEKKASFCKNTILKEMLDVRDVYDSIEPILPDAFKPFPNYDDLLF